MYCANCGTNNPDGALFCENCGTKMAVAAPKPAEKGSWSSPEWTDGATGGMAYAAAGTTGTATTAASKNNMVKMLIAIAVVLFVTVGGVLGACALFGNGPEKPIEYIEKAYNKRDVELINKALPKQYNENGNYTIAGANVFDYIESRYGMDFKVKFKVISKSKCTQSEIVELEEDMNNDLKVKSEFINIKAAYLVKVQRTIEGDRDRDMDTMDVYVVKIGGKWYLGGYDEVNKL